MAVNLSRAATTLARTAKLRHPSIGHRPILRRFTTCKWLHDGIRSLNANPVAVQMVDYALSHARSQKSGHSHFCIFSNHCSSFLSFFFFFNFLTFWLLLLFWVLNLGFMIVAESYAQSLLVLEQCLSNQPTEGQAPDSDNSRGIVLMAMSTLLSERWVFLFF